MFKVGQSFEDDAIITENIIGCIWRAVYNKEVLNGVKFEAMPICEDMVFMIDLFNKKPKVSIVVVSPDISLPNKSYTSPVTKRISSKLINKYYSLYK